MQFNTLVAEVSCPKCQHPIMTFYKDPRGVELPHCCDLYWVPRWKVVGGKLQFHLTYYRPEGMAYEKNITHENEIQEDRSPSTDPQDIEHNVEHHTQNNTEHSDPSKPTRPKDVEHHTQTDVEHNVEHNDKAIAREFLSTRIVSAPEHFETTDGIYSLYQRFAETQKSTPLEARKLYALLRERYAVEKTRRRVNGQLVYGFIGIRCDAEGL